MKYFAELIKTLDSTNKTNAKIDALATYFKQAPDRDKVWAIAILSHRRPPRPVNTRLLREWAAELANIPLWLFEESYHIVGDLAETIALIIPNSNQHATKSLAIFLEEMIALKSKDDSNKKAYLYQNWITLNYYERFVFNKLITGGFRIGVSQKLMTKALCKATGISQDVLAYRLMGNWNPSSISFQDLVLAENETDVISKPYPFYLAYPIENTVQALGKVSDWSVEHKWDGIRAQLIVRNQQIFVWSRGEELVTDKYPEFNVLSEILPNGTVLDGEILPFKDGKLGTFNELQTRIARKNITKPMLAKTPVILRAYDLLEWGGKDIRSLSYVQRRESLEQLYKNVIAHHVDTKPDLPWQLSERIPLTSWDLVTQERNKARAMQSEGLMLKRNDSPYLVGRKKGDWWKWKVDPLTIDAVLTYAMRGHGRRANLFTDYTFGLWNEDKSALVTFAKAYSGLTDAEFKKVDKFIKANTLERFGPVRSVTPTLVFEIAFEGISHSKRHKSGVATRFPRILRWRQDKKIEDANTLQDLLDMIP